MNKEKKVSFATISIILCFTVVISIFVIHQIYLSIDKQNPPLTYVIDFEHEHPKTKIIGVIVNNNATQEQLTDMAKWLVRHYGNPKKLSTGIVQIYFNNNTNDTIVVRRFFKKGSYEKLSYN